MSTETKELLGVLLGLVPWLAIVAGVVYSTVAAARRALARPAPRRLGPGWEESAQAVAAAQPAPSAEDESGLRGNRGGGAARVPPPAVPTPDGPTGVLARCHGYVAVASDGPVGEIETPLFPPGAGEPEHLIVRVAGVLRPRMPVVWVGLVQDVDAERRLVYLDATREEIRQQPEHLLLAV